MVNPCRCDARIAAAGNRARARVRRDLAGKFINQSISKFGFMNLTEVFGHGWECNFLGLMQAFARPIPSLHDSIGINILDAFKRQGHDEFHSAPGAMMPMVDYPLYDGRAVKSLFEVQMSN